MVLSYNFSLARNLMGVGGVLVNMRKSLLVFWLLMGVGMGQREPILPRNSDPHQNPGCSPRGSATTVACSCLGMVNRVQTDASAQCWKDAGVPIPEEPALRQAIIRLLRPNPLVMECLKRVPDHCEVIGAYPTRWGLEMNHPDSCGTSCKPENCKCADSACKPHGDAEGL